MLRAANKRLRVGERIPDIARSFRQPVFELIGDEANSHGITVATSASVDTKGLWVELGTTTIDADGFYVQLVPGTQGSNFLVDIGTGGSGSEVALVSDIWINSVAFGNFHHPVPFYVPLPLKAGTRISCRAQRHLAASADIWASVVMAKGEAYYRQRKSVATTYGANSSDTTATTVDPGGTANTTGTPAQLSASTSKIDSAIVFFGRLEDISRATASWYVELCVGAAAAETTVYPGIQLRCHSGDDCVYPYVYEIPAVHWPAGSRLSARARCSINTAGDRLFDCAIIGFS